MAKRRRRNKKWLGWLGFLLLTIVAGVVGYLVWDAYFKDTETPKNNDETGKIVVEEKKEETEKKEEKVDSEKVVEKEEVKQYEGSNPNESTKLTGAITYAGVSGDYLMVRVNIDQYLSSGKCNLVLAQGNETVYGDVAPIADAASTSTCEGFNVPLANLPSGRIQITVTLESDDKVGVITGEVEL